MGSKFQIFISTIFYSFLQGNDGPNSMMPNEMMGPGMMGPGGPPMMAPGPNGGVNMMGPRGPMMNTPGMTGQSAAMMAQFGANQKMQGKG